MYAIVDGELAIVTHVFERDSLSHAAYNYMIAWVQKNTDPEDDPEVSWKRAEEAWDALSPELQATLWQITRQEKQNAEDIREGLLATLHGYQGFTKVKEAFADAIRSCLFFV